MKTWSIFAATVSALALLAGCGGGDDTSADPVSQDASQGVADAPAASETAVTDVPDVADTAEAAAQTSDSPEVETVSANTGESLESPALPGREKVMIVMDGSGSMWGQIDGKSKMSIAREALRDLVGGLPADTPTGLIAYGHRKKGDCSDIELLASPVENARDGIFEAVDAITPTGKTPLSAAVQQAAETLKYEEDRATVILITDGIETCDIDPCALGEDLSNSGIAFTTHIVGFGLSESEGRQVACLAEETGGQYIEASNAGELSQAMEEVAEAVTEQPEEIVVGEAEATLSVPESVPMGTSFEVSWTGPEDEDNRDYIDLVLPDHTKTSGGSLSFTYAQRGSPLELRAPANPGPYKVRYVWVNALGREVIAEATLDVTDAEVAIFAPESVGIGQMFDVTWRGPGDPRDYIDMVPLEQTRTNTQITYAYTNKETLQLKAPGTAGERKLRYIATGSDGERVMIEVPIMIEDIRAEVAFNPSVELGSTLSVDWTGPNAKTDYIDIVERGFTRTNTQLSYAYTSQGNPAELKLPTEPGEYDVRYILAASDGERILATAPLELTETEVSLAFPSETSVGETLVVDWVGPGARLDYIDIVERGFTRTNTQISYAYTSQGNPAELKLPGQPGEYDVRYILKGSDGERVMAVEPLTIEDAEFTMDHDAMIALGEVLEVEWTGPKGNLDYIDIVERDFRKTNTQLSYAYTKSGDFLELSLPAEPGEYDVRFILKAGDGERIMLRQPLTVTDTIATLDGPATAETGTLLEIDWQGPGSQRDFIDIVPRGKKLPKDSIHYAYTRSSNPVELRMPDEPGEYDMRYIHVGADTRVVKARREITVE